MVTLSVLETAWYLSDSVFDEVITSKHALTRPIHLRNPFIFYLGHLPSFTWATLSKLHSLPPVHSTYDQLFVRGIDPDVEDPTKCHDHPAPPPQWPSWNEVQNYKNAVRNHVRTLVTQQGRKLSREIRLFAEHDLMHIETLHYMLAQGKRPPKSCRACPFYRAPHISPPATEWIRVEGGTVALGLPDADFFVWDNEMNGERVDVNTFEIGKYAVSIGEYLSFVRRGGYKNRDLWKEMDWEWVTRECMAHPASWAYVDGGFLVLTGKEVLSVDQVADWPVSASLAEARAYATWAGGYIGSEKEWLLAAYGSDGARAEIPEYDVMTGSPTSVKEGLISNCGAVGMVGNGWELLDTKFEAFRGFESMKEYAEYSSDFFDGKHFVLKGGSWATHKLLLRPSFRNFYQARYPYVFSKFRLFRNVQ